MGVPSFFVWLCRRYPRILCDAIERWEQSPSFPNPNGLEFDTLLVDMNGIIHPCCRAQPGDPAPSSYGEMFDNLSAYLDRLFHLARPRKFVMLAIDGVAPRAKMNRPCETKR